MRMALVFLFMVLLMPGLSLEAGQRRGEMLSFDVTDSRKVLTRSIDKDLLLRVVKESSPGREHYGWRVEVVRKPYKRTARNLLYHSRRTLGAHPSHIFAWHVGDGTFPNERELAVSGYPLKVRIALIEPVVEGSETDKGFVSGTIEIKWERK